MSRCYELLSEPWRLSTLLLWLLGGVVWGVQAGCNKLTLSNILYQTEREGTYKQTGSVCSALPVYKQTGGGTNYMFYMKTSDGWNGWMVGSMNCENKAGIAVETSTTVPEQVREVWEEVYQDKWYYSTSLTVECHRIDTGTVVGAVIAVLLIVAAVVFIVMRCYKVQRQRSMRSRPQQRRQGGVSVISGQPSRPPQSGAYPLRPQQPYNYRGPSPRGPAPTGPHPGGGYPNPAYNHPDWGSKDLPTNGYCGPGGPAYPPYGPPLGPPPPYPGPRMAYTGPQMAYAGPRMAYTGPRMAYTGPRPVYNGPRPGPETISVGIGAAPPPYQETQDPAYPPPPAQPGQRPDNTASAPPQVSD